MFKKIASQNQGFTLAELMVVVGVVGFLTAVAIPKYQTYQAKSKRAEAYIKLADVYTGLTAFYMENDTYTSCLQSVTGLNDDRAASPIGTGYYAVGFSKPANDDELGVPVCVRGDAGAAASCYSFDPNATARGCPGDIPGSPSSMYIANKFGIVPNPGSGVVNSAFPPAWNLISDTQFRINAYANFINSANPMTHDRISIDQNKRLVLENSGLP